MTKQEAKHISLVYLQHISEQGWFELVDKMYEAKRCDGCVHHLSQNGNYPLEPCGECSRFYADGYEA